MCLCLQETEDGAVGIVSDSNKGLKIEDFASDS